MATIKGPDDVLAHFGLGSGSGDWPMLQKAFFRSTTCGAWIETTDTHLLIGSIVEGHDADTRTQELEYPFDSDEISKAIDTVEEEAAEMWHEANCHDDDCRRDLCVGCVGCDCFKEDDQP